MYKQLKKVTKVITNSINSLNNSKFVIGIMMLLLNIGSKYIELGLTKTQEHAIRNALGREVLIFAIVFMGTRDIVTSTLMSAAFIILSDHLFNEKSKLCIVPKMKNIASEIDENKDNIISPDEEKKALEILRKAKAQKNSTYFSFEESFDQ
tara:strand:+ start:7075 stop:7527 length:453 start_codon:yes stop_codon:yes gene_type:complete